MIVEVFCNQSLQNCNVPQLHVSGGKLLPCCFDIITLLIQLCENIEMRGGWRLVDKYENTVWFHCSFQPQKALPANEDTLLYVFPCKVL